MTLYPEAHWLPVANHGGAMTSHLGLILHVQVGNNSLRSYFNNPTTKVSSTFWVSKIGRVEQYVDAVDEAWAQVDGNSFYNSVETEGYPSQPLTPEQIAALAAIYVWGHREYLWPVILANSPGQRGLGTHAMGGAAWGGHTGCPGTLRTAERGMVLAEVARLLAPPMVIVEDTMLFLRRPDGYYMLHSGHIVPCTSIFFGSLSQTPITATVDDAQWHDLIAAYPLINVK